MPKNHESLEYGSHAKGRPSNGNSTSKNLTQHTRVRLESIVPSAQEIQHLHLKEGVKGGEDAYIDEKTALPVSLLFPNSGERSKEKNENVTDRIKRIIDDYVVLYRNKGIPGTNVLIALAKGEEKAKQKADKLAQMEAWQHGLVAADQLPLEVKKGLARFESNESYLTDNQLIELGATKLQLLSVLETLERQRLLQLDGWGKKRKAVLTGYGSMVASRIRLLIEAQDMKIQTQKNNVKKNKKLAALRMKSIGQFVREHSMKGLNVQQVRNQMNEHLEEACNSGEFHSFALENENEIIDLMLNVCQGCYENIIIEAKKEREKSKENSRVLFRNKKKKSK